MTKKLKNGTSIPLIGLGTWLVEEKKCAEVVKKAIEIGYRHIDTALLYQNHHEIKNGIKGFQREELFITSKIDPRFLELKNVESDCDRCLKELGCDYLDLFLIHWPDRTKPLSKIVEKMLELKEKGKILNVGVSNFTINQLQDLLDDGLEVGVNQVEFHPYLFQKKLLDFCNEKEIALTAYSPLARGKVDSNPVLQAIGKKYHKSPGQVALRWLLQHDLIAIPKASSEKHLKENIDVFDFNLLDEEMKKIDSLNQNLRLVSFSISDFDY